MAITEGQPIIVSKIGIIGAGVSGLAAAKQLFHHNPVVFEATDSIGGIWKHCTYKCTKLQSQTWNYEFSDFPWPKRDSTDFPTHEEIMNYLNSYATNFDLFKLVKFTTKVVEVKFVGLQDGSESGRLPGDPGNPLPGHIVWEVAAQTDGSDTIQRYGFEYLVICTGKYGDIPLVPSFPRNKGPEVFKGKVLHSLDYCKLDQQSTTELVKGKKVVLVGYKKSAIDLALECAEANQGPDGQPCTIIIRSLHWTVLPEYRIWGLPFFLFYATRFAQVLNERPNQGLLRTLFCNMLYPLRRGMSKFIESYLSWKMPLDKYGLRPDHPFVEDFASCQIAITPEEFFKQADKGKIVFKRASKFWFWEGGVEFDDNTRIEADVVILATGFDGKKKLKAILPDPFRSLLEYPSGLMPLYRGTIHPLIPNMAFVGYVESVSNLYTSEIRSMWLAGLIDKKFKLPNVEKMLSQTFKDMEAMKKTTRFYKRQCITTFSINHNDEICEDLGWNTWRKKNWLLEAITPYSSADYKKQN